MNNEELPIEKAQNALSFEQKNKSAMLDLAELAATMELGDSHGSMPKNIPMQPGELLKKVQQMIFDATGEHCEFDPIVIREQYCQVNRQKIKEGEALDLEDYIIKRFVTKIKIPSLFYELGDDYDSITGGIALSYAYTDSVKGVQIAFGETVSVCDNLTAFGRYRFTTYGTGKVSFDEGMQLLEGWLRNIKSIHQAHVNTIVALQSRHVSANEFKNFIGSLFISAVVCNNGYVATAPLNQSQVAGMVQELYKDPKDELDWNNITAWDVMNFGTFVIKPNNSDMLSVISDTTDFNDFVLDEFKISFEIA